jgi:hypothetical protein
MKKPSRYVIARHEMGFMGSHFYVADMETGEVAETMQSLSQLDQVFTIETRDKEPVLERAAFDIEKTFAIGGTVHRLYRVHADQLSIEL